VVVAAMGAVPLVLLALPAREVSKDRPALKVKEACKALKVNAGLLVRALVAVMLL